MTLRSRAWWIALSCGLALLIGVAVLVVRRVYVQPLESRQKLVDNFNDGADPNLIGGPLSVVASAGSSVSHRYVKTTLQGRQTIAYAVGTTLKPHERVQWTTGLNDLDISAATNLSVWLRVNPPIREIELTIADSRDRTASVVLTNRLRPHTRWQHIRVPLNQFRGIEWNQLKRLELVFQAEATPLKVGFFVDDLAFEGPPEVFFRSLKDNVYDFPTKLRVKIDQWVDLPAGALLRLIAQDTWGYFRDLVDIRHHLPLNSVQLAPQRQIGDYTSPTDVALYLLSVLSAYDLGFVDRTTALDRLRSTVSQVGSLPSWRGFLYNYYNTTNLQVTRSYVSSVDNGWLAAVLIVLRQAFPELAPLCNTLLDRMDFRVFYDEQRGQMRLGYDAQEGAFAPYHYGLIATEARMLSLVAIGKQDVPEQHWFRVYRTLPQEWEWQRQIPQGTYRQYRGYDVFQGYYTYQDAAFVPSWGGSLFEFLMPTLLVKEGELAPHGLGLNDQRVVELHMRYALHERGYPVWGLSPSATPNPHGGYKEFGVPALGAKGYEDHGVVTPHSSILALEFAPEAVIENVRQLLRRYPIYGEYGFYDAVDVRTGHVAYRYLALDQGMILPAINNYVNGGILRNRFHADPVGKRIEWLLQEERFF